ncbi:MAG: beta-galactosidase, partial [Firmicutes bacterium]|nr:beta-galactosidase [Bacillota bacterium]
MIRKKMEQLPFRQIHLDFHTSPLIEGVGRRFDAKKFVKILKEAHVNSVNVFAKCHHGMSYYPTKVGVMHPHLKRDLLGEMIQACHREGIRVPVYISVVWDEDAARKHNDWVQVDKEGRLAERSPLGNFCWRSLCLASPYVNYVQEQTREILEKYEVDGFWFDIIRQIRPGCVCNYCLDSMEKRNLDPENNEDLLRHSLMIERAFMGRMSKLVWGVAPNISIFYNSRLRISSSPEQGIRPEIDFFSHFEIESLPSGLWGYTHFPYLARYYRTLGKESLGMTGRFHKTWADFGSLRNKSALEYECFRALAYGAKCSIGDQLHPRGELEPAVYKRIGEIYGSVKEKEKWCENVRAVAEIGLISSDKGKTPCTHSLCDSDEGALRVLLGSHYQFDILDQASEFERYNLLILPDEIYVDKKFAKRLQSYLRRGGRILLSYCSGLYKENGTFMPEMGIQYKGQGEWCPYFIRLEEMISKDIPQMDYVMYERGNKIEIMEETEVFAWVGRPYFNRSWKHFTSHRHSPLEEVTHIPEIIKKGNLVYIASPIFRAYRVHGSLVYKRIIQNSLDLLLPEKLIYTNLPSTAEVTLNQRGSIFIVHILHYIPERRSRELEVIEDTISLYNTEMRVKTDVEPSRLYLIPQKKELDFSFEQGYVIYNVP